MSLSRTCHDLFLILSYYNVYLFLSYHNVYRFLSYYNVYIFLFRAVPRKLGENLPVLLERHHLFDAFRSFICRGSGALNGPFSSFHPIVLKIGVVVRGETISTAETEEFFCRTISVGFFPLETLQQKISRLSPVFLFDGIVV